MKSHKATLVLFAVSVLALAAGVVAGTLASRMPASPSLTSDHSLLSDTLQLTPQQRDKMRTIWEGVRDTAHQFGEQAQQLQRQRDDAVFALLNDEQKAKYNELTTECAAKISGINTRRESAFKDAVQQTEAILTPAQRTAYEQLIKERVGEHALGESDSAGSPVR
jgi:Spy/CpxP family protein refolding chaperone